MSERRKVLMGLGALGAAAAGAVVLRRVSRGKQMQIAVPEVSAMVGEMPYRVFGRTGLSLSELGFGAWGIGGQSYGPADRSESLASLARAEELGCNFVDTAAVYGDSEAILGEFLSGRRSRWVLATKYSGQPGGLAATVEEQLQRLRTDYIDFYMIHWVPRGTEAGLLDQLFQLKRSGKVRHVGVSLYNTADIDHVIDHTELDGVMVPLSLLDPYPFLARRERLRESGLGVLIRSVLKEGFLTGRFTTETRFTDASDQRSQWPVEQVVSTVERAERFRFLEAQAGTMARAAIGYALSFPEVSSVVVGARRVWEAEENFGRAAGFRLDALSLQTIRSLQRELGLKMGPTVWERLRAILR